MKVIVAFDSFKGCLTAVEACETAREAILSVRPGAEVVAMPMSDGGEGMVEALHHLPHVERVCARVHDPLMRECDAEYLVSNDATAYMEVAERIGLCFDRLIYNNKVNLSPEVISTEVQNLNVVLTLDQPVQAGTLYDFELAGADGRFVNTDAVVVANKPNEIIIRKAITAPKKVRYAWKDNPIRANVRSLSGLPMSSFEIKL